MLVGWEQLQFWTPLSQYMLLGVLIGVVFGCFFHTLWGTRFIVLNLIGLLIFGTQTSLSDIHIDEPEILLLLLASLWLFRSCLAFVSISGGWIAVALMGIWLVNLGAFMGWMPQLGEDVLQEFIFLIVLFFVGMGLCLGLVLMRAALQTWIKERLTHFGSFHILWAILFVYIGMQCLHPFVGDSVWGGYGLFFGLVVLSGAHILWDTFRRVLLSPSSEWTLEDNPYIHSCSIALSTAKVDTYFFELARQHPHKAKELSDFIMRHRPLHRFFALYLWEAARAVRWAQSLENIDVNRGRDPFFYYEENREAVWKRLRPSVGWNQKALDIKQQYLDYKANSYPDKKRKCLIEISREIDAFEYYNDKQEPIWKDFYIETIQAWRAEVEMLKKSLP